MLRALAISAFTLAILLPWVSEGRTFEPEPGGDTGKGLRPVNLPVNTEADEDDPHVSDNGMTLYWTVTKDKKDDVWVVKRKPPATTWAKEDARVIEGAISTRADDRSVYATTGRYPRFLYFATKKDLKNNNFDLYVVVGQDVGRAWSTPTPLANVNTEDDELHPWLSFDGKTLYFTRRTKDKQEVYYTTRAAATGGGGWGEPRSLGLPPNFSHATVSPDGRTMYLQGRLDGERWALYVSRKTGREWGRPEPLAALNNLQGKIGDLSPSLSGDGKTLYFASDRPGGKGGLDLYSVATAELGKK